MKTKKMASTAKKSAKKAIIIAMAAIAGANYAQEQAAMRAAMQDMKQDGEKMFSVSYDYNPYDGMIA